MAASEDPQPHVAEEDAAGHARQALSEAEILAVFREFDTDHSNTIDRSELQDLVFALGVPMSPEQVQAAFDAVDSDGSGEIDWEEFYKWFTQEGPAEASDGGASQLLKAKLRARYLKRKFSQLSAAFSSAASAAAKAQGGATRGAGSDIARYHVHLSAGDVSTGSPPLGAYITLEPSPPSALEELGGGGDGAPCVVLLTLSLKPGTRAEDVEEVVAAVQAGLEVSIERLKEELQEPDMPRLEVEGPLQAEAQGGLVVLVKAFLPVAPLDNLQEALLIESAEAEHSVSRLFETFSVALQSSLPLAAWLSPGDTDLETAGLRAEARLELPAAGLDLCIRTLESLVLRQATAVKDYLGVAPPEDDEGAELIGTTLDNGVVLTPAMLGCEDDLETMEACVRRLPHGRVRNIVEKSLSKLPALQALRCWREKTTRIHFPGVAAAAEAFEAMLPQQSSHAGHTSYLPLGAIVVSPLAKRSLLLEAWASLTGKEPGALLPIAPLSRLLGMSAALDRLALVSANDTLAVDFEGLAPCSIPGMLQTPTPFQAHAKTARLVAFGDPSGSPLRTVGACFHAALSDDRWEVQEGLVSAWTLRLPSVDICDSFVFESAADFADVVEGDKISQLPVRVRRQAEHPAGFVFITSATVPGGDDSRPAQYLAKVLKLFNSMKGSEGKVAPLLVLGVLDDDSKHSQERCEQLKESLKLADLSTCYSAVGVQLISRESMKGVLPAAEVLEAQLQPGN